MRNIDILHSNPLCIRCWINDNKESVGLFIYNGFSVCKECVDVIKEIEGGSVLPLWKMGTGIGFYNKENKC